MVADVCAYLGEALKVVISYKYRRCMCQLQRFQQGGLQGVLKEFLARVLPFREPTAILCAAMHVSQRRLDRDARIAATAKEHGYTVATHNTGDFDGCRVQLLNPWLTPDPA